MKGADTVIKVFLALGPTKPLLFTEALHSCVATETRDAKDKNYVHELYCFVVKKHLLKNAKLHEVTLNNQQWLGVGWGP